MQAARVSLAAWLCDAADCMLAPGPHPLAVMLSLALLLIHPLTVLKLHYQLILFKHTTLSYKYCH